MHSGELNIDGNSSSFPLSAMRQTVLWLAVLLTIIASVGYLSNWVLQSSVERAVHRGAIVTSERWATYFANNIPRLNDALAGKIDDEQVTFVKSVEKHGDVFRFKLFDVKAKLVFVSDEVDKRLGGAPIVAEEEPHAQSVLTTGQPNVAVQDGTQKKNRPPLYAEAYVPVKDANGRSVGVVEVYVDQTQAQALLISSFYGLGFTLAALVGFAVAVPGAAFLWQNKKAVSAIRKAAELEAAHLALEREQSAELSVHNDKLVALNQELAERMRELGDANGELIKKGRMEQLGQLTATVAHELRNPLGAVRTSAYLLERKLKDKGMNVDAQLERINKGIIRCDNIITQLLDFSRTKQLQTTGANLDEWLVGVLEEESKKLPFMVAIECELALNGQNIPFDGSRLQRAIVNLVSNASEAMVGQGDDPSKFTVANPKITLRTSIEGEFAKIEVADNGPGMTPDVLTRIREPLFTTKSFGTGLGVPAIEQIATQHGGRLEIASDVGHGAKFTVYLPIVAPIASEQTAVAA